MANPAALMNPTLSTAPSAGTASAVRHTPVGVAAPSCVAYWEETDHWGGRRTGMMAGAWYASGASRRSVTRQQWGKRLRLHSGLAGSKTGIGATDGVEDRADGEGRCRVGLARAKEKGTWGPWARAAGAQGRAIVGGSPGSVGGGSVPAVGGCRARDAGPPASRPGSPQGTLPWRSRRCR